MSTNAELGLIPIRSSLFIISEGLVGLFFILNSLPIISGQSFLFNKLERSHLILLLKIFSS